MCLLCSLAAWFFPSTISNLYDFVDSVNLRQEHQHSLDLQSHKKKHYNILHCKVTSQNNFFPLTLFQKQASPSICPNDPENDGEDEID